MNENYVTKEQCLEHMQELEQKFDIRLDGVNENAAEMSARMASMETMVSSIKGTLNMVLTAIVGGMVSIIGILLTRGIQDEK